MDKKNKKLAEEKLEKVAGGLNNNPRKKRSAIIANSKSEVMGLDNNKNATKTSLDNRD